MREKTGIDGNRRRQLPIEEEQAELMRLDRVLPSLLCDNGGAVECEALIRGIVVREYALIDLSLTALLFGYYFGFAQKELAASVDAGRFLSFYELAENVPLVRKLKLLRSVLRVPPAVCRMIQRINETRNAIAHVALAGVSSRRAFRHGKERLFSEVGMRRLLYEVRYTQDYLTRAASELYEGAVKFRNRDDHPHWYEVIFAQAPGALSCALLAEQPEKSHGRRE